MTTTNAPAALRRELKEPSEIVPLRPAPGPGPELAILVPTLNERGNIAPFIERLGRLFLATYREVVFVDDSYADGTAEYLRVRGRDDRRIRCIQRVGRRGLSWASIEGLLSTSAGTLPLSTVTFTTMKPCCQACWIC